MSHKPGQVLVAPAMSADPAVTLATGMHALQGALQKCKAVAASLERTRREQEETIEKLRGECAALEQAGPVHHHKYVPFEPFAAEQEALRQLALNFSMGATPELTWQESYASMQKMFGIYERIIHGLREINLKGSEEVGRLKLQVLALRDPFHAFSPGLKEICKGYLEMMLGTVEAQAVPAGHLLLKLLQTAPQHDQAIYNLALYIATISPQRLAKGQPLYEKLRDWMIGRAAVSEPLIEKRNLLLLALGRTDNGIPRDLADPLAVVADLEAVIKWVAENPTENTRHLLNLRERSRAEQLFCDLVRQQLDQVGGVSVLENPETAAGSLSLFEQLATNPRYNQLLAGARGIGDRWKENKRERELIIRDVILACCQPQRVIKQVLAARPDGDVANVSRVPAIDTSLVDALARDVQRGAIPEQHRDAYLDRIEGAIFETCARLTQLDAKDEKQFAREFCRLFAAGRVPPAFAQILGMGDGRYALYLARLVYYHEAISHIKPGFEQFASHYEWDWLAGDAVPPPEAAHRLRALIQSFAADDNFRGSAMVPKQVRWASHLCDLMTRGKITPIYSDAGSGKTSTAIFTMRLLQRVIPDICRNKAVHLLSPFYSRVQGLQCHQLIDPRGTFYIDVENDAHLDDVVLVDEAHILDPDIKIVLRSLATGATREVQPLPMTATPVIPHDAYDSFKNDLHLSLQKQYRKLAREYERLSAEFEQQKRAVTSERFRTIVHAIRQKKADYCKYLDCLPMAQREYFQKHLESNFSEEDIEMLLVSMDWFLRAGERGSHLYRPKNWGLIQNRIPAGYKPLQHPDNKQRFDAALKLFEKLDERLQELQEINKGYVPKLPEELQQKGQILERMRQDLGDLQRKLAKWERQAALPVMEEEDEFLRMLPAKRKAKFATIAYAPKELTLFSAESAAAEIPALNIARPIIQLIYPGVRFTPENFPGILAGLNTPLAVKFPDKQVYFIYQDSHSADGDKGRKFAVRLNEAGAVISKEPMAEFALRFNPDQHAAVLLYDTTNKQGGDFNSLSRVADHGEVQQFLFYHLTDDMEVTPLARTSANDLYQALSRRRGVSQVQPVVIGTAADRNIFVQRANERQWTLEKAWAARNAAARIAKKLLKAYGQRVDRGAMAGLRHRTLEVVQAAIAPRIDGLAAVPLVHALRAGIPKIPLGTEPGASTFGIELLKSVDQMPVKMLIHEAMELAPSPTGDDVDYKDGDVVGAAQAAAHWRVQKLQQEVAYLTQSAVRYVPYDAE